MAQLLYRWLKSFGYFQIFLFITYCDAARDYYTAAVFDYGAGGVPQGNVTSREGALEILYRNLDVLESQVKKASDKGAEIFVFPEYGLSGRMATREHASHFLETIPDPHTTTYCPCDKPFVKGEEVLYRLSCVSKNYTLYVAANMADKQPCLHGDKKCPITGFYQYNTEVVFNQSGCLVARYHKQHLFESEKLRFDTPSVVEFSYFDTDFGRFGLFICFDAVFRSPATDLVEKYNITDVIFSTAWMNVFPHFESVAYHSGWARTMKVNYLMSNIHLPLFRLVGSGIFTPEGIADYVFNEKTLDSTLLVSKVPVNTGKLSDIILVPHNRELLSNASPTEFKTKVFGDDYKFTPLFGLQGNNTICYDSVCCHLEFSRSTDSELYALGVFNDMHYLEGTYHLEVCLLVMCPNNKQDACGTEAKNVSTLFKYFTLTAEMDTVHAYPQIVSLEFVFPQNFTFVDEGTKKTIVSHQERQVLSVVHMGRNFDKDPKTLTNTPRGSYASMINISYLTLGMLITISVWFCLV